MSAAQFARVTSARRLTVAVAESMTGGELAAAIVGIDGSGDWFRGGVVAYAADVKHDVLGVARGPVVCAPAVMEMASGVASLLDADIGIATTGCVGPLPMEGQPVGTLWIGIDAGGHHASRKIMIDADTPAARRRAAVDAALAEATATLLRIRDETMPAEAPRSA